MAPWKVDTSKTLMASFTNRTVWARGAESAEALIKRFKTVVEKSGVLSELKRRKHHKSKGEKVREKALLARKRARKGMRKRTIRN
jgi:small subunit ribosomal protein S21